MLPTYIVCVRGTSSEEYFTLWPIFMKLHKYCPYVINKWKKHFYEMKGEVGMSWHENERQQEVAYTKTESIS